MSARSKKDAVLLPVATLTSAADLALMIDETGTITEVWVGDALEASRGWQLLSGKVWSTTVTIESRAKVTALLSEAQDGHARSRELNQNVELVGQVPFRFTAVAVGTNETLLLGRDLRPMARLQQQVVTAQQSFEREYEQVRQAATRYRVLFHVAVEGVLVATVGNQRIVEVNPAAASMLGETARAIEGRSVDDLFRDRDRAELRAMLSAAEAGGRPAERRLQLAAAGKTEVTVALTLFRQSKQPLMLVRFWPEATHGTASSRANRMMMALEAFPDGFVATDERRRILSANPAFCELVQQASESQVVGESIDRWLGRPGVDVNIIVDNLKEHGVVKSYPTVVRSDFGNTTEVTVTAVSALDGQFPCIGFAFRTNVTQPLRSELRTTTMGRSVEQLRALVGRVSLKELVRESGDLVEKLCIEAALDVSGNNRASAAQLLGLSRQGLYLKLRRHGLAEFGDEAG